MNDGMILTIALVLAITEFVKMQLDIKKKWLVWLVAGLIMLALTYLPVVIALFPEYAPWLTPLLNLIVVVLAAGGTVDFIKEIRSPKVKV